MWQYQNTDELYHAGVKGMKWGYNDGHANGGRTASEKEIQLMNQVMNGQFGNGQVRFKALQKQGVDPKRIQLLVNAKSKGENIISEKSSKTLDKKKSTKSSKKKLSDKEIKDIVNKVIRGNYGNGFIRKNKLKKAGYNYKDIQHRVNQKILGKKAADRILKKWNNKTIKSNASKKLKSKRR